MCEIIAYRNGHRYILPRQIFRTYSPVGSTICDCRPFALGFRLMLTKMHRSTKFFSCWWCIVLVNISNSFASTMYDSRPFQACDNWQCSLFNNDDVKLLCVERSAKSNASNSVGSAVYIAGGVVVGGVSVLILIALVSRHRRSSAVRQSENSVKSPRRNTSATNMSEDQTSTLLPVPTSTTVLSLDIAPSSVHILQRVGNARFGTIYIGTVVTPSVESNPVIIKTLAGGADPLTREFFIRRTQAMVGLKHCNVVGLIGACLQQTSQSGIISALYEHYDGVDLNTFIHTETALRGSHHHGVAVLLKLAVDCACGLACLSEHWFTHGDVTPSNVLVVNDATVTAKICDFGLSSPWCCCCSQHHHHTASIEPPADWPQCTMAPELLLYGHEAISSATDVWQFGLILHQIYDVIKHQHLVAIVTDCWREDPAQRPRFSEIHHRLLALARDPVIDRVTGQVISACDLHTSNASGYSHQADTHRDDDDGHHGNSELMITDNDITSTLPCSSSSSSLSSVVVW